MKTRSLAILAMAAGAGIGGLAVRSLHAEGKPQAYVIVEVDVANQDAYLKEYVPSAGKILRENGATYLARGGKTASIEGDAPKRIVVLSFDSIEKAQAAFNSEAYRENRKIGLKYAKFRIFAIEAVSP